jgi:hypothetical protein
MPTLTTLQFPAAAASSEKAAFGLVTVSGKATAQLPPVAAMARNRADARHHRMHGSRRLHDGKHSDPPRAHGAGSGHSHTQARKGTASHAAT